MESFARRPIERTPVRRPVMGGVGQRPFAPRPAAPASVAPQPQTTQSAQPSLLQPPVTPAGPSMDIRPNTPARPVAQPQHTPALQPQPHSQPAATLQNPTSHQPVSALQSPQAQASSTLQPLAPAHSTSAAHHNTQPHSNHAPTTAHPQTQHHTGHTATAHPHATTLQKAAHDNALNLPKHHKHEHPTVHTGLVGFITFVLVGAVCLAPVLPGKIWQGAPGASESFSTGDQNLDCLSQLGAITTTLKYDRKLGSPLVYSYATTSDQSASCDGQVQHAIGGHTSQFNPLALLTDFALTLGIAIAVSKLWRKLRTPRD